MSEHVDLGQLQLEDRSSELSCTMCGNVCLAQLDDNIQDLSGRSLTDRLSSFDAWILTGRSVRLEIETVLHESCENREFKMDIQQSLAGLLLESMVNSFTRHPTTRD